MKNPADFIGGALGQSESQTKAILANTVGKVLIIDEVMLRSLRHKTLDLWHPGVHAIRWYRCRVDRKL